jgi:hypothetical protein
MPSKSGAPQTLHGLDGEARNPRCKCSQPPNHFAGGHRPAGTCGARAWLRQRGILERDQREWRFLFPCRLPRRTIAEHAPQVPEVAVGGSLRREPLMGLLGGND